jgi:peptide/nickel transport system permease protein
MIASERRTKAFQIFKKSQTAIIGLIIISILILTAIFANVLSPYDPIKQNRKDQYAPPSMEYFLGADIFGRDILSRLIFGTRIAIFVGITPVIIAGIFGGMLGIIAGYSRGFLESIIMRVADLLLSFPSLLLGILVVVSIGSGLTKIIIAISIALFPRFIRLSRSSTLAIKERDSIEASRAIGCSAFRIMIFHILPSLISEIIVMGTLWIATAIRIEASLSFLGLGTQPPTPSWGRMLRDGVESMLFTPWQAVFAGLFIMFAILGFNLIGDGLRDSLDPKLQA